MWLVRNGVPFDVAWAQVEGGPEGEAEAKAWSVILGTFEGGEYDWERDTWKRRDA